MKLKEMHLGMVIIYLSIVILAVFLMGKTFLIYRFTNDSWTISKVNYGFAVVTNGQEEVLVRNPVANLKEGQAVIVRGFDYNGVPYIYDVK